MLLLVAIGILGLLTVRVDFFSTLTSLDNGIGKLEESESASSAAVTTSAKPDITSEIGNVSAIVVPTGKAHSPARVINATVKPEHAKYAVKLDEAAKLIKEVSDSLRPSKLIKDAAKNVSVSLPSTTPKSVAHGDNDDKDEKDDKDDKDAKDKKDDKDA